MTLKIYLDHNVIEYFFDEKSHLHSEVKSLVLELKNHGHQIVYSPAHIEEIAVFEKRLGRPSEVISQRLKNISYITNNLEIRPFYRNDLPYGDFFARFIVEDPSECYSRVIKGYSANDWAENYDRISLKNSIDRRSSRLDKVCSNNINNEKSEKLLDNNFYLASSMRLAAEYSGVGFDIIKSFNEPVEYFKRDFRGIEGAIETAAKTLDEKGFYPDSADSFRGRLHDISHLIYASYCDVFITNDKNLFNKSKVIFSRLEINVNSYRLEMIKENIENLNFL